MIDDDDDDEYPWRQNAHKYYLHLTLSLFLFLWFILGNYWVFSVFLPNFIPPFHHPQNYCDKTLYMFAICVLVISHTALALLVFCSCCIYCFSRQQQAVEEDWLPDWQPKKPIGVGGRTALKRKVITLLNVHVCKCLHIDWLELMVAALAQEWGYTNFSHSTTHCSSRVKHFLEPVGCGAQGSKPIPPPPRSHLQRHKDPPAPTHCIELLIRWWGPHRLLHHHLFLTWCYIGWVELVPVQEFGSLPLFALLAAFLEMLPPLVTYSLLKHFLEHAYGFPHWKQQDVKVRRKRSQFSCPSNDNIRKQLWSKIVWGKCPLCTLKILLLPKKKMLSDTEICFWNRFLIKTPAKHWFWSLGWRETGVEEATLLACFSVPDILKD